MQKYGFKMQLNPGCAAEYRKRHDEIWPELVDLLHSAGVSDYSIFLDPETLILFGVLTRTDSVALPNESDPPLLALPVPVNIDLGTVAPYPVGNGILIDSIAINSPTDIGDTSVNGIIINGSGLTGTGDIVVQNVSFSEVSTVSASVRGRSNL